VTRAPSAAIGLLAGYLVDLVVADPPRAHPVAVFGRSCARVERVVYADAGSRGALLAGAGVASALVVGAGLRRATATPPALAVTGVAVATWTVLGGTTLVRTALEIATALERDDLPAARALLPALCGRDPERLDATGLARATIESVAENTSDAVVAPLTWGALAGIPGLLGYRAVNTLDAMVGHRCARYARFGWAAARLDDIANLLPARLTALLTVAAAPAVGASAAAAWRCWRRDGGKHPSPNAGRVEAAFAGALGVRLGGSNVYAGRVERRGTLGDGRPPAVADIRRAARLSRAVALVAVLIATTAAAGRRPVTR
jgi:adenosylcobinamide-phosphate synthase